MTTVGGPVILHAIHLVFWYLVQGSLASRILTVESELVIAVQNLRLRAPTSQYPLIFS